MLGIFSVNSDCDQQFLLKKCLFAKPSCLNPEFFSMKYHLLPASIIFIILCQCSYGQLFINEVQSSNLNSITDEYGNHDDWIELYNSAAMPVDITGVQLSDNLAQPGKFIFPSYVLNPNEHLKIGRAHV